MSQRNVSIKLFVDQPGDQPNIDCYLTWIAFDWLVDWSFIYLFHIQDKPSLFTKLYCNDNKDIMLFFFQWLLLNIVY